MNVLNASNTLRMQFKFEDFVDYVFFFYRDCPQYCSQNKPYQLWEVERAVKRYYKNIKEFDSIDRENLKHVMNAYRAVRSQNRTQVVQNLQGGNNGTEH
jgi:hypothetical protein